MNIRITGKGSEILRVIQTLRNNGFTVPVPRLHRVSKPHQYSVDMEVTAPITSASTNNPNSLVDTSSELRDQIQIAPNEDAWLDGRGNMFT